MKDSFDQHPGHNPTLPTASRQAGQSGGSATLAARPKAVRTASATRPRRPGRACGVVASTCMAETLLRLPAGLNCGYADAHVEPLYLRSPNPARPAAAGGSAWT